MQWKTILNRVTNYNKWYLAKWARRMSWKEISEAFCVSWDRVFEAVKHAVHWGLAHRSLDDITAIGVDEVQWHRGHQYQTVVYQLKEYGYEPVLTNGRWVLLKRPANLTQKQAVKLKELLQYNLKSVRSYLMREDFQRLWEYSSAVWAGKFLDAWCTRAMRSRIEPMKKVARSFRDKRDLILNWFHAEGAISAGTVEGFNNKLKLVTRKSYGFRTQEAYEIALYHNLGALPEKKFTHEFL
jgi:transposase